VGGSLGISVGMSLDCRLGTGLRICGILLGISLGAVEGIQLGNATGITLGRAIGTSLVVDNVLGR